MGQKNSSIKEKVKNVEEKQNQFASELINEQYGKEHAKIKEERKDDFKSNLTIRIYSEEKCQDKYKKYLEGIIMEKWNINYIDNGFSSEKTKVLENIYLTRAKENKKDFDEILMIIIDSCESFINLMQNNDKNFLNTFNISLYNEAQPFFLFVNKNPKDFDYISSKKFPLENCYIDFDENCMDFITDNKEEYNIEIHYEFEYDDASYVQEFLEKKKKNKDNFNIIIENKEYIYNSQYCEEESKDSIQKILENSKSIIIKNIDYNIKLKDDYEYLFEINKKNKIQYYFEYYKPKFNKSFDDFLSHYELLDRRNFKEQYFYYCPFIQLQRICGYYHEYGDLLIKNKFAKYPSRINIGVCGRAGAGKSTLLNTILGEKRCLEGQGTSVSTFIASYCHPKYPINFIDFPGFGDKNYADKLIEHIKKKNNELKEVKEEIHAMIYCINFDSRIFIDKEDEVVKELYKLNILIIFVFTKGEKENTQEFIRYKNNFLADFDRILKKNEINDIDLNKDLNLVSIYSMREKKHGCTIEPFGIDTLFKIIHDKLKDKKISKEILESIDKTDDEKEIIEIIKSTPLKAICNSRNELIEVIRKKISVTISLFLCKFVLSCPKYVFMDVDEIIFSIGCDVNDLLNELSCAYCKTLNKDESSKLVTKLSNEIIEVFKHGSEITEEDEYIKFKGSVKWYYRVLGLIFAPLAIIAGGAAATILSRKIKHILHEVLEKKGEINLSLYLTKFAEGLNEGIDGLEKISEEFRKSYYGH